MYPNARLLFVQSSIFSHAQPKLPHLFRHAFNGDFPCSPQTPFSMQSVHYPARAGTQSVHLQRFSHSHRPPSHSKTHHDGFPGNPGGAIPSGIDFAPSAFSLSSVCFLLYSITLRCLKYVTYWTPTLVSHLSPQPNLGPSGFISKTVPSRRTGRPSSPPPSSAKDKSVRR